MFRERDLFKKNRQFYRMEIWITCLRRQKVDMAMRIVISQRVRSWVAMVAVHTFSAPKPFKVKDKNQEQLLIDFDTYITTGKDGATDHTYRQ